MDKTKEAIMATTQVVEAYKEQGHNVIGHETWESKRDEKNQVWNLGDFIIPKQTKRIAVIYLD